MSRYPEDRGDGLGWIQLYRSFKDWEWFTDVNTSHFFVYCLLRANHKDTQWRGISIKRGSFITSLNTINKETGLSVMQARTCIRKLISTNELTSETTNKNHLISIVNYNKYQESNKQVNKRVTNEQQTNNKRLTTDNNENNVNNVNNNNIDDNNFCDFWLAYPQNNRGKGSRKDAQSKFVIALKKDNIENIMQGVRNYEAYIRRTGQSNKDAFRWLEKEAWRDDYTIQSYIHPTTKSKHQRAKEALGLA